MEALELDQKVLTPAIATQWPSYFRENIQQDMAKSTFKRGRDWVVRNDWVRACRVWKLGFQFYRGDVDLLRELGLCSRQAAEILANAQTCEALRTVVDLAVEGDGLAQKAQARRTELKCP